MIFIVWQFGPKIVQENINISFKKSMNKNREQIQKISAHVQFETVSPATKLL